MTGESGEKSQGNTQGKVREERIVVFKEDGGPGGRDGEIDGETEGKELRLSARGSEAMLRLRSFVPACSGALIEQLTTPLRTFIGS